MSSEEALVCAYRLLADGHGEVLPWDRVDSWRPEDGMLWVHLDANSSQTGEWLRSKSGLKGYVVDGLLAAETRPRADWYEDGILLILRGVNLNPGADPEDMVSIRLWIDKDRVISTRLRRLMAIQDLRDLLDAGRGPSSTGGLVAMLSARMIDRMAPVIEDLDEDVDALEDQLAADDDSAGIDHHAARRDLNRLRRSAISLRRHIAPQRDALERLWQFEETWLDRAVRGRIRETADRVTRITEELDEIRERSALVQEELLGRISQRMEQTMYVLTIVATIVLPLGFVTGLLGINVGGIPGAETPWAFWAVCAGLAVIVVAELILFRRLKWL